MRVLTPQKIHLHFRMLSSPDTASGVLNINCCDPLGRSALLMAIDNENLEMVELLLENKVSKRVLIGFFKEKKIDVVAKLSTADFKCKQTAYSAGSCPRQQ